MKLRNKSEDTLSMGAWINGNYPLLLAPGEVAEIDLDKLKKLYAPEDATWLMSRLEPADMPKVAQLISRPPPGPMPEEKEAADLIGLLKDANAPKAE